MKKIKLLIAIFLCLFAFTSLVACEEQKPEDNKTPEVETQLPTENPTENPTQNPTEDPTQGGSTVNVDKAELNDATEYYTGKAIALMVKNLPGGVKVEYTYTLNGEAVTEMVEIGEYQVTAVIKDKSTGEELKTLTATLSIVAKPVVDEIPNDANSNIELTYETTYIKFYKDPDDETRLIAAGLELYAEETIYFVLDRDPSWTKENFPLEFLLLDPESVACATLVDNALVISEQGTYDVIMSFPEGQLQPTILVREGKDSSVFYFRGSMNDYTISEEYTFVTEGNTATFETDLAVDDVFIIGNYYYSVSFEFNPSFMYYGEFTNGGEFGTDVKVGVAGHYKFVVDLTTKTLKVYKDGNELVADTNKLFVRGNITNPAWDSLTLGLSKVNGVASIELELAENNTFKVANADWSTAYGYDYVSSASDYFGTDQDNNIVVKQAGTYKVEVDTNNNKVTVYYNGNKIVDAQGSTGGGNQGGGNTQGQYQIVVNGTNFYTLSYKGKQNVDGVDHEEHWVGNVYLNAGDVVTLHDTVSGATWAVKIVNPYSHGNCVAGDNGITIGVSGNYDIYVQFAWEQDKIYFGPAGA